MAENIPVSPEQEARDLSAGTLKPGTGGLLDKLLEYHDLRRMQREWLFYAAILFCVLMTGAFLLFVAKVVCLVERNGGFMPDWHLLLLGSGLILPPTIVLFGLMRRVYLPEDSNHVDSERAQTPESPSAELLSGVGETLQKVVDMITTLSDKIGSKQ